MALRSRLPRLLSLSRIGPSALCLALALLAAPTLAEPAPAAPTLAEPAPASPAPASPSLASPTPAPGAGAAAGSGAANASATAPKPPPSVAEITARARAEAATRATVADDPVAREIAARVARLFDDPRLASADQPVVAAGVVTRLYQRRNFLPVWSDPRNQQDLIDLIEDLHADGLSPQDAHHATLIRLARVADPSPAAVAELDILMTDAIARIGYMLAYGKTDPADLSSTWNIARVPPREDPVEALDAALAAGQVPALMDRLRPDLIWYKVLRQQLARYRALADAGGWPLVPAGEVLKPGMRDARVPVLRERLAIEGDGGQLATAEAGGTGTAPADPQLYEGDVVEAVRRFQARHAIEVDGVIGPNTLAALNVTADQRVDQLRVNMERARQVHRRLAGDFMLVNIAGFYVAVVDDSVIVWETPVIVGSEYNKTPLFTADMSYLEFNPTWTPTRRIVVNELLPAIQRDIGYLERNTYQVVDGSGTPVDPHGLPWSSYTPSNFPWRIVQQPGPGNALGRVKFMFPNRHAVYLHDTPSRGLFERTRRTFSHGCIRVKDPLRLAEILLAGNGDWDRARIDAVLESGKTTRVNLTQKLPVLLLYWTADPDPRTGGVKFYPDIYGRDAALLAALDQPFHPDPSPLH